MTVKIASKPFLIGAAATALACGMAGYVWNEKHRQPLLEIYVFDLKSGSSVFIRTPDDARILINGGGNAEVIRELTGILPFYSRRIDTVIATDANGKDVSGLIDILERYSVDRVVVPAVSLQSLGLASSTDQIYGVFLDTAKRLKIPLEEVSAGGTLDFGQKIGGQRVKADILFPAINAFAYSKASAPEIIMKISYGGTSVMLLGNATTKVQKFLVSSAASSSDSISDNTLGANVLVVTHSALAGSLSAELINKMKPEYLLYSQTMNASPKKSATSKDSSSKNKKVDPLYSILDDKRFNIKEKGTVKIVSDGVDIRIPHRI